MMPTSTRRARILGLAGLMMAALAVPSVVLGQAPGAAPTAPAAAAATPPVKIGSIDMDRVFKEYKKVKSMSETLKNDALAKQAELQKIMTNMQQLASEMKDQAPGSPDFKTREDQLTRFKAQLEAEREQAQGEFARREAEALAGIYQEVQAMTAAAARQRGFTFVVKVSNEPVSGTDPNSVMAAMARSVVYFDPTTDLTTQVVYWLNQRFDQAAGVPPATSAAPAAGATTATQRPATDAAARPASATATAPAATPAPRR
jgi:outer membrane protein